MTTEDVEEVSVAGATLWTVTQGVGAPLVLCHGGPGLSDNLGAVAAMLDDIALVHRYDQRGSGRSHSDGPFTVEAFVADLEALRAHWGHDGWIVGGHSWGANLALFYALAHPERTLGLVYIAGTGLRWGWQEDAMRRRLARLTDDEREELARLQSRLSSRDDAVMERFLRLMWTTDFADRATSERLGEEPLYAFPRNESVFLAASADYRTVLERGVSEKLRQLDFPVLVVHGAHDTDPARVREVAETALRGRYVELSHSAHVPWLEEPEALGDVLRAFVSECA